MLKMVKMFGYTLRKVKVQNEGIKLYWFKYKPKPIRNVVPRVKGSKIKREKIDKRIEEEELLNNGYKALEEFMKLRDTQNNVRRYD